MKNLYGGDIIWVFQCRRCGSIWDSGRIKTVSFGAELPLVGPPVGWKRVDNEWYCPEETLNIRAETREQLRIEYGA